jgi:hypothetical protein
MANYDNSKAGIGAVYPDRAIDGQEWKRVEPLITPKQLRRRQLFGIPLVSYIQHPITNQRQELDDEDLLDFINRATATTELETGLTIFPTQFKQKSPFDSAYWQSFGHIKLEHRPVSSVEELSLTPSNGRQYLYRKS